MLICTVFAALVNLFSSGWLTGLPLRELPYYEDVVTMRDLDWLRVRRVGMLLSGCQIINEKGQVRATAVAVEMKLKEWCDTRRE